MASRLIIGLGTGRCGTSSLRSLLEIQHDTHATHEIMLLPYRFSDPKFRQYMNRLWSRKTRVVADVALWNLPYVTAIMGEYPSTKFICLQRDKEAVVKSFMRKTAKNRNHWTRFDSKHWDENKWFREKKCPYRNCYPRFDADKEEALGLYWDYYDVVSKSYQDAFPDNFRIFPLEDLNSRNGCEKILHFAGYEEMVIRVGIHKNYGLTKPPKKRK